MKQTLLPRLSPRDGLIMALLLALGGTGHSSLLPAQTAISQGKAAQPFQHNKHGRQDTMGATYRTGAVKRFVATFGGFHCVGQRSLC